MGLLDDILSNDDALGAMAKKLGLPEDSAKKAASALAPALSRGLERNASKAGGVDDLLGALKKGNHEKYVEEPDVLGKEESIQDGNAILGHIFGSKDVSRNVAAAASQQTGLDVGALKKMLPMLAPVVMGVLAKQTKSGGGSIGLGDLTKMLGGSGDNELTDQLLDLAKRYT